MTGRCCVWCPSSVTFVRQWNEVRLITSSLIIPCFGLPAICSTNYLALISIKIKFNKPEVDIIV
uniref:Uncharacterized protein n=1 Tax=Arundo donax TaxID=35708 RepID=A0A0A9DTP9_ARUDO